MNPEKFASAGNTEVPAYLVLRNEGFSLKIVSRDPEMWEARKEGVALVGPGPLELLALWAIRSRRGEDWRASDLEIDEFINRFYPNQNE